MLTLTSTATAHAKESSDKGAKGAKASDPAAFLVKDAEQALNQRKWGLSISLYRGIVAIRGEGDEAVWKLAEAWTLAGEFESAIEELELYHAAVTDVAKKEKAREEIASLEGRLGGFGGSVFVVTPAEKHAAEAFKRGRTMFKAKKYAEAVAMFRAGIVMAPDMPGSYRELGEAYDKLGRSQEATDFFVRYLRLRPFGKNADQVRSRLEKAGDVGKLSIETSFPCEQVWMNRQELKKKLPVADLVLAPGRYKILCYNPKYAYAGYEYATVTKAGKTKAKFDWAILENALDPWGRIVLENPENAEQMRDIGLHKEIGVPVPDDRRALKVKMSSADGTKKKEILLKLDPGKRFKIEW